MLSEIFLYFSIIFYDKYISGANEEEAKVAQINHMSFKYPTSPLLSQPENTAEESVCSLEKRSKECADTPLFCECVRMIEVSPNKNVDIVLIDQGKSSKRFIFIIQVHCFFIFFSLSSSSSFFLSFKFSILDSGFGGNVSYTFHIHGYNASILGRESFGRAITKEEVMLLDRNEQLHRNFLNPPRKDSFVVPNKGYLILRLFTDNLGKIIFDKIDGIAK